MNTKKKIGARIAACLLAAGAIAGVGVVHQATISPAETTSQAQAAWNTVYNQCQNAILVRNTRGTQYWLNGYYYANDIYAVYAGNNGMLVNGTYYRNHWVYLTGGRYYASTCWA